MRNNLYRAERASEEKDTKKRKRKKKHRISGKNVFLLEKIIKKK